MSIFILALISCGGKDSSKSKTEGHNHESHTHEAHEGHDHGTMKAATTLTAENKTCPVSDEPVDEESKVVTINGKNVRICCDDCEADLKKDPAKYKL